MSDSNVAKESLVFGLDIGTRAVVGVVGYREKDKFVVKAIESIEHETRAMLDGQIHDIQKVALTVQTVKERLEEKCQVKLKDVCIAAAGRVLKTENVHPEIEYEEDTLILDENLYDLLSKGIEEASIHFQENNESREKFYCVGKSVVKYYLNDSFMSNLINHKGKKIAAEMICTFLPYEVVDGLYKAVELAGLEVSDMTLEPIAAIEVAIPEKYRMLNIALVDVGAGTSDICITRDGSVVAYGMIPLAGDSLSEIISTFCLVEFNEAEKIKKGIGQNEVVEYEDILGIKSTITKKEVLDLLESKIDEMAKQVSEEINRLNGGNNVNAIFVVGGGGKIEGYTNKLAEYHNILVNRVALRGEEVMNKIIFKDDSVEKDSLIVTPLGICLHYYEENNSFINVNLNDERLKLYDNGKLTIVDAVMQMGIDNNDLFPKRGDSLEYFLNKEKVIVRGEPGDACQVFLNSEPANLHTPIHSNDIIKIIPSTKGAKGSLTLSKLTDSNSKFTVVVNETNVTLPNLCTVNGEIAIGSYKIADNDEVEVLDYMSVGHILELVDISLSDDESILVNNEPADFETKVYSMFNIKIVKKKELSYSDLPEEDYDESEADEESNVDIDIDSGDDNNKADNSSDFIDTTELTIIVNKTPLVLKGKSSYVFVDVFDYIDFDLSKPQGNGIVTLLNGKPVEFLADIHDGDCIDIYWKEDEQ